MNWLAHLLLSEPTPEFRLGGILPDLVSAPLLAAMPSEFQRGIRRHREIDAFTDAHPIFRRSVQRLKPPFRRFGGILVDVYYDHFLTGDWHSYSDKQLPEFVSEFYASFESFRTDIPPDAYARLQQMQTADWLCSYGDVSGVAEALQRIGSRLRRPFDLGPSISVLEQDYDAFHTDFTTFFPDLSSHVKQSPNTTRSA
ncbi:MAG TPA: ACP phosphodiesterase [Chthoniobacterales bacterium]|jgi:acyl carrier protein phosphodiesterase